MSKLKRLITQLSQEEFQIIHNSLLKSDALKSAELLEHFKAENLTDHQIKDKLGVNNNAFYTLRSRLNEKIESFFLEQMESPRTTLLKQVASINEILLTKTKTIAIATLKKLEKELTEYDLANELTLVYKALKKLHINSPEFFEYSQAYNRHVAYMLAVDKAEDLLADYFKKYGQQLLNYDKSEEFALGIIKEELLNTKNLYKSHRLYVYYSLCELFHNIIVEDKYDLIQGRQEVFKIFDEVESILGTYRLDPTYHNLKWVFKYLKMLYFNNTGAYDQVDELIRDLNNALGSLINNFSLYTCPVFFLNIKLERYKALGYYKRLKLENTRLLKQLDVNNYEVMNYISVSTYLALSHYYIGELKEGVKILENIHNEISLKQNIKVYIDIKLLEATFQIRMNNMGEVQSIVNNIQRQIRILDKDNCMHSYLYLKIIKSYLTDIDETKKDKKLKNYIQQFKNSPKPKNSPIAIIDTSFFDPEYIAIEDYSYAS